MRHCSNRGVASSIGGWGLVNRKKLGERATTSTGRLPACCSQCALSHQKAGSQQISESGDLNSNTRIGIPISSVLNQAGNKGKSNEHAFSLSKLRAEATLWGSRCQRARHQSYPPSTRLGAEGFSTNATEGLNLASMTLIGCDPGGARWTLSFYHLRCWRWL